MRRHGNVAEGLRSRFLCSIQSTACFSSGSSVDRRLLDQLLLQQHVESEQLFVTELLPGTYLEVALEKVSGLLLLPIEALQDFIALVHKIRTP